MDVFIGVDGGGSGCRAVAATADGGIIGRGTAGPANVFSDRSAALINLRRAMDDAMRPAGVGARVAGLHAGLAGVLSPAQAASVAAEIGQGAVVTDDRTTSVAGALGARDGALAAIGTGAFVAVKQGQDIRGVGGWGLVLSDQGSGAWLGRSLLSEVLLWRDGMAAQSPLLAGIWARFGQDPARIVRFAMEAGAENFASLAPDVIAAAEAGDEAGRALMRRGADWLERGLAALNAQGGLLCLSGGVGPHYAPYLDPDWQARLVTAEGTALEGALALALGQQQGRQDGHTGDGGSA